MSTDLVRQVSVSCGLVPPSMQYIQKDRYEQFLNEAYCGGRMVWGRGGSASSCRDKGLKADGKVRKGLCRQAWSRMMDKPADTLEVDTTTKGTGQRQPRDREKVTNIDFPILKHLKASPPAQQKRIVTTTRRELLIDWGITTMIPKPPPHPKSTRGLPMITSR
eukprot:TRINITY_DN5017_c0_g1_i1.p1 TRINITY_DN5017_c0_g1~~TRINITY_DN5017_c0_g1_i1.p1  ORF type:complete len:163 (+),score=27.15 TRINITY_DN5017_c0_g1_i1:543-1031(+)